MRTLCGLSLLNWSDAEYAFLFWMQGGVPGQFRMSPGMRWYSAVGLHTAQGISDKLRELARQYFCRKGSLCLSLSPRSRVMCFV